MSELFDKTVIITGATSGIGKETAMVYASHGAHLILTCRTVEKGQPILDEIRAKYPLVSVEAMELDLASFSSVQKFAEIVIRRGLSIDILILNAGIHIPYKKQKTVDGVEVQYQVNYLSNALLFELLKKNILKSDLKKIVYISSEGHKVASKKYGKYMHFWYLYAVSKEAAMTYFFKIQELYPELTVYVSSPGSVSTNIHRNKSYLIQKMNSLLVKYDTPEYTARYMCEMCTSDTKPSVYWHRGKPASPASMCFDRKLGIALFNRTYHRLKQYLPPDELSSFDDVTNFSGTFARIAHSITYVENSKEIKHLVQHAWSQGKAIRVAGKLHSYNDIAFSRDIIISLKKMNRIVHLDKLANTITFEGGATINSVVNYLDDNGYTLKFTGNFGRQTMVGAIMTGTHGYNRSGGVMGELVTKCRIIDGMGHEVEIQDEDELGAFRVSFGTLGIVTQCTMQVEKKGLYCIYSFYSMPHRQFMLTSEQLFKDNEYLRFYPNYLNPSLMSVLTLNRLRPGEKPLQNSKVVEIETKSVPSQLVTASQILLNNFLFRGLVKLLPLRQFQQQFVTEFSARLFTHAGLVTRKYSFLSRVFYNALNRDKAYNLELAIEPSEYGVFSELFYSKVNKYFKTTSEFTPYHTCRFVGASSKVLFAPNYKRDVIFVDIHVSRDSICALQFLSEIETRMVRDLKVRFHWGKFFQSDWETVQTLYPRESFERFRSLKKKYDPEMVFSNEYTKRVLNV